MTKKIFWEDPYLTELETRIASVKDNDITVEETIFYAFAGGQESDYGSIGDHRVLQARKEDKEIVYTLENSHRLKSGDQVRMKIDYLLHSLLKEFRRINPISFDKVIFHYLYLLSWVV